MYILYGLHIFISEISLYLYETVCFYPQVKLKRLKLLYVVLRSSKIYKDFTLLNVNPAKLNINAEKAILARIYLA